MNLGEMRQAVRDDVDEATAAHFPNALINRYLNRSAIWVRNIVAQLDEDFLERRREGTYAGSARETLFSDMNLPDETLAFVGVWDITDNAEKGIPLDHVTIHTAEALYSAGDSGTAYGGNPAYYISGNEGGARVFGYRPIPSSTRTLRFVFVRTQPEMKTDRDEPDLPGPFHEAVPLRAVVLCKNRERAPVQAYQEELNRVIQTAVLTLDGRHADMDTRMQPSELEYYSYDI